MEAELYRSGVPGLDEVMLGGFLPGRSIMIEGYTGTGKTVLGMSIVEAGIREAGEAGVIVSFEQLPETLYGDARSLGWDLRELERQDKLRVVFVSASTLVEEISTQIGRVNQLLAEIDARRLFLDGINMLDTVERDPFQRRRLIDRVLASFRREGLNVFFSREKAELSPLGTTPESYIADTVIQLSYVQQHGRRTRYLEVVKSRGQPTLNGIHSFTIGLSGVKVYPRQKAPLLQPTSLGFLDERASFDVPGLDDMLDGGLYRRSTTLIAGSSGTGKTLLSLQFVIAGAQRGERGMYISLEEPAEQIIGNARILAPNVEQLVAAGILTVLSMSPLEMDINEQIVRVRQALSGGNFRRLAFDGLSNYEDLLPEVEYKDYVYALLTFLKAQGVTAVVTSEIRGLTAVERVTEYGTSYILDNIIMLRFVELGNTLRRALVVLKTRGSGHANDIREYVITSQGIDIIPINPNVPVPVLSMQQYAHLLTQYPSVHESGPTQSRPPRGGSNPTE
jgi:circadian clock protein KaiC